LVNIASGRKERIKAYALIKTRGTGEKFLKIQYTIGTKSCENEWINVSCTLSTAVAVS
jgi:hypothetical protein